MRPTLPTLVAGAVALGAGGCSDHPLKVVEYGNEGWGCGGGGSIALNANGEVDILFVVDNSGSMHEEQAALAEAFPALLDAVDGDHRRPSYHIGITTTDNGNPWCTATTPEGGALQDTSCLSRLEEFVLPGTDGGGDGSRACTDHCRHETIELQPTPIDGDGQARPRPWIQAGRGAGNLPADVTLAEAFACMAPLGIAGCGFESPLESMYKALRRAEDSSEAQRGFVRENAALAIVFVTDEADCSYRVEHDDIFSVEGERTFWTDPSAEYPSSSVCWNAGVACEGGPGVYDSCHTRDVGADGTPSDPADAVLHPVRRYVDLLQDLENHKKRIDPARELIVAAITGVPPGYTDRDDLVYAQAPADDVFGTDFGIAPGCEGPSARAVPPVRVREVAEQFGDGRTHLYSVCDADYRPALAAIGEAIAGQLRPACMPVCVADADPSTDIVDPSCILIDDRPTPQGPVERRVPPCVIDPDTGEWSFETADDEICYRPLTINDTATPRDDMSQACIDDGWNLEFAFEYREGLVRPAGSMIRATCEFSTDRWADCPDLG